MPVLEASSHVGFDFEIHLCYLDGFEWSFETFSMLVFILFLPAQQYFAPLLCVQLVW